MKVKVRRKEQTPERLKIDRLETIVEKRTGETLSAFSLSAASCSNGRIFAPSPPICPELPER